MLFGVEATDPGIVVGASILLVTVALPASAIPAWKAGRTNPVEALRSE